MNEPAPKRLRWWFWLVLFAPAILFSWVAPNSPLIKLHPRENEILVIHTLLTFFGSLNLICSLTAAAYVERMHKGNITAWSLPVAASFFFLNVVMAFAGCLGVGYLTQ